MAGVTLRIDSHVDSRQVLHALGALEARLDDLTVPFSDVGEYLLLSHEERWRRAEAPDGTTWADTKDSTKKAKRKNKSKILVLDGYLKDLSYEASKKDLRFGTNRVYGAYQFYPFKGGMDVLPYLRGAHRRKGHTRGGKRIKAHVVNAHTVGGHTRMIDKPGREFLGISSADDREILEIFKKHFWRGAFSG